MGRTEIYFAKRHRGDWELYAEVKQARNGALAFWMYLEKKYLPPYMAFGYLPGSRLTFGSDKDQWEVWDLCHDPRLTSQERLLLFSTFDYRYLPVEHVLDLVEAMRWVHGQMDSKSNFGSQADVLVRLFNERKDAVAVSFVGTSVCSYSDVIGCCFDREMMSNIWEEYLEAEPVDDWKSITNIK